MWPSQRCSGPATDLKINEEKEQNEPKKKAVYPPVLLCWQEKATNYILFYIDTVFSIRFCTLLLASTAISSHRADGSVFTYGFPNACFCAGFTAPAISLKENQRRKKYTPVFCPPPLPHLPCLFSGIPSLMFRSKISSTVSLFLPPTFPPCSTHTKIGAYLVFVCVYLGG